MQDASDTGARVVFNCGNSPYDVSIDNVSLIQEPPSSVEERNPRKIDDYALASNSPNPFNDSTNLEFQLRSAGRVTIDIFDCLGRPVRRLEPGALPAGPKKINLSLQDRSSGVYFCRITSVARTDGRVQVIFHKIVLIR
jgi:hypothetical protein